MGAFYWGFVFASSSAFFWPPARTVSEPQTLTRHCDAQLLPEAVDAVDTARLDVQPTGNSRFIMVRLGYGSYSQRSRSPCRRIAARFAQVTAWVFFRLFAPSNHRHFWMW